ncbi:AT hook motif-containing protein, partial [Trifolium medium]|nr:AT hook motif-containing protein [Trifolium medium]
MNQQNQGSGVPSNSPMKRKRGRPRKEENNVVHGVHKPENVLNFNQPVSTATNSGSCMLGKTVTGVIEAAFNDGFLVNVKAPDSDSFLRGVVFLPGQVNPVTAETDVAPHVQMINRKEFPIPMPMP